MPREPITIDDEWVGWVQRFQPRPMGHAASFHSHDELEFNLVVAGRGGYLVGRRRYDLSAGSVIWLFPAQEHVLVNESSDFDMWIAVFRRSLIESLCTTDATMMLREANPAARGLPRRWCCPIAPADMLALTSLCQRISEEGADAATVNAGLGWLLVRAWRATCEAEHAASGADIHRAVERAALLLRDSQRDRSLEELAEGAGLSVSRLSRLFKQQTGQSITDFRNRRRIERFIEYYGRGGRTTMLAAALRAGFGSYAQFHRVFKRIVGMGPADYRNKLAR